MTTRLLNQQKEYNLKRSMLNLQITNLQRDIEVMERHINFVRAMGGPACVARYLPNGEQPVQHPKYGKTSQSFILYFYYSRELPALKTKLQQKLNEEQTLIQSK